MAEDRGNGVNDEPDVAGDTGEGGKDPEAASKEIEAFAHTSYVQVFFDVLDHHLSGDIDRDTYEKVGASGILLIGDAGFPALVWASDGESRQKIQILRLSPKAEEFAKRVCALYGSRLVQAYELSEAFDQKADDWESFSRSVYRAIIGEGYRVDTEIVKYNGEKFVLSAGLPSAARLAVQTLKTLLIADDFGSLEARDRDELKEAVTEVASGLESARNLRRDSEGPSSKPPAQGS